MWYSQGGTFNSGIKLDPPKQSSGNDSYSFFDTNETIKSSPKDPDPTIPKEKSEYKDIITVRARNVEVEDAQEEYFTIKLSSKNKEPVNITDWIIQNNQNEKFFVGRGSYLPYSARVNIEKDIILEPGEEAIIISGKSPIGVSFKQNICTGFFTQFQNFTPSLKRSCPMPSKTPGLDDLTDYECIDYVESLTRCVMPISHPFNLKNSCIDYVNEHINYNGCVNDYKNSEDFYLQNWMVYLAREQEIWKGTRGTIKLFDEFGRLIKEVGY